MTWYQAEVIVRPRPGVRDPQADAVGEVLRGLAPAQDQAKNGRLHVDCVGRYLRLFLEAEFEAPARARIESLCRELLVNPHLEVFQFTVEPCSPPQALP